MIRNVSRIVPAERRHRRDDLHARPDQRVVGVDTSALYPQRTVDSAPEDRLPADALGGGDPLAAADGRDRFDGGRPAARDRADPGGRRDRARDPGDRDARRRRRGSCALLGQALGVPKRGERLARQVAGQIATAKREAAATTTRPRVAFLYVRGAPVQMIGGTNTRADSMIVAAGGRDAGAEIGIEGFQPITAESLVAPRAGRDPRPHAGLAVGRRRRGPAPDPRRRPDARGPEPAGARLRRPLLLGLGPRTGVGAAAARARAAPGAPLAELVEVAAGAGHARPRTPGRLVRPAGLLLGAHAPARRGVLLVGRDRRGADRPRSRSSRSSLRHARHRRRRHRRRSPGRRDPLGRSGCRGSCSASLVGGGARRRRRRAAGRLPQPARRSGPDRRLERRVARRRRRDRARVLGRSCPGALPLVGLRRRASSPRSSSTPLARYEGRTEIVTLILTGVAVNAIAGAAIGLPDRPRRRPAAARRRLLVARQPRRRDVARSSVATLPFVVLGAQSRCARRARAQPDDARRARGGAPRRRHRAGPARRSCSRSRSRPARPSRWREWSPSSAWSSRTSCGSSARPGTPRSCCPAARSAAPLLVVLADLVARTVGGAGELPLGVVTSLLGGPFFLWLLWRTRRAHGGWG